MTIVNLNLTAEEEELLARNTPAGEDAETAARRWLFDALRGYEESVLPYGSEDPRRGFRVLRGGMA